MKIHIRKFHTAYKFRFLCLTAFFLFVSLSVKADEVDNFVKRTMQERRIPSVSIAVIKNGKIIKPSSMTEMYAPAKLNNGQTYDYGLGWAIHKRSSHSSVGYSGGFSAAYERFLDDKLTVIVLSNLSGADPDSIVTGIAAVYIPTLKETAK